MNSTNLSPISPEEALERATVKHLRERFPALSEEIATSWARDIDLNREERLSADLRKDITQTRQAYWETLKEMEGERIREEYRNALEAYDLLEATLAYMGADSSEPKIELRDIEEEIRSKTEGNEQERKRLEIFLQKVHGTENEAIPIGLS